MKRIAQLGVVVAGALGALGTAPGEAAAQVGHPEPSLLHAVAGADVGTVLQAGPNVVCGPLIGFTYHGPVTCVNGPIRSGNSRNSGNFVNRGNPNNSGNLSSSNGSTGSNNEVNGDAVDSGNSTQLNRGQGGRGR
ncbi:hypothetical protein ACFWVC_09110 [Streptomyces sp. NPDC058691]|uniref:hypothetical protein n=1 Tax=Streptomyces sp. NPDC058691 TaxID=3346601 RepID=UPI00364DD19A